MRGKLMLYVDQYGTRIWARTVGELAEQMNRARGTPKRMYRDTKRGTKHVGYVVAGSWFTAYVPYEGKP